MNKFLESESIKILTQTIRQYSQFGQSCINMVKNTEQLSVSAFAELENARYSIYHINRASNTLESFLGIDRTAEELLYQNYAVKDLMEKIREAISQLLSPSIKFSIDCTYSLKEEEASICIDQTRLVLIIFNTLYYCFDKVIADPSRTPEFVIHVRETDPNFIISITDVNAPEPLNPWDLQIFRKLTPTQAQLCSHVPVDFGTVSLLLAKKLALKTSCKFDYKRVKHSNRYILTVPKKASHYAVYDAIEYQLNINTLLQSFADILIRTNREN